MSRSIAKQSQKARRSPRFYAAVRSKNEIYYQMASVFKQIAPSQKKTATKILEKLILAKAA